MNLPVLTLFLRKELRDLRGNRQIWPAYLILPALGVLLPALLLALLPYMMQAGELRHDPGMEMLLTTIANDPSITGATLAEKIARLLLRDMGMYYLLMPVVLAGSSAGLVIVREKEQRTLEPILATPLRDRDFLLAKLFASLGPALLASMVAWVPGTLTAMVGSWWRVSAVILPTSGNLVGTFLLGPVFGALAALVGLRVSARFTDVPGATQFTGLVVLPAGLVMVAVIGRPAMASPLVGVAASLLLGLVAVWLFRRNVRKFRREEILTRWR